MPFTRVVPDNLRLTGAQLTQLRNGLSLSNRVFGIELEFRGRGKTLNEYGDAVRSALGPRRDSIGNRVFVTSEYFHSNGRTWDLKLDGSCEFELATPRLTMEDWPKVVAVTLALRKAGARVDRLCGLHVTHEARDLDVSHIRNLIRLWSKFDKPIHEGLPPSRRNNVYARRSFKYNDAERTNLRSMIVAQGRYESLNLTSWWRTGRIEFRAHHGTLDLKKILQWTCLTQRFIETARYGRPQRIIAKVCDAISAMNRLEVVIGRQLAAIWSNWIRVRNPDFYDSLIRMGWEG